MNAKAAKLKRLLAVREAMEQLARLELQRYLASLTAVEKAIAEQDAFCLHARHTGDAALRGGDQKEWLISQAEYEVAGWNKSGLEEILAGLSSDLVRAREQYVDCHRESEQAKALLENLIQADRVSEDRRSQTETDGWFLSRRAGRKLHQP